MAQKYVMVRVEVSVYNRLNSLRGGILLAHAKHQCADPMGQLSDGLSLSSMIGRLCGRLERDRRRVREARQRAVARRQTRQPGQV